MAKARIELCEVFWWEAVIVEIDWSSDVLPCQEINVMDYGSKPLIVKDLVFKETPCVVLIYSLSTPLSNQDSSINVTTMT